MDLTAENHKKYTKMSKKDLVTEIVGICIYLIMRKDMIDDWLNKKQTIMELHRAIREDYTKKYEKWELEIIIFNEDRIIGDIEYILDKKVCNKIHIPTDSDDETPIDEVPSDSDEEASESQSDYLRHSEKILLPMIIPLIKTLSDLRVTLKQRK